MPLYTYHFTLIYLSLITKQAMLVMYMMRELVPFHTVYKFVQL